MPACPQCGAEIPTRRYPAASLRGVVCTRCQAGLEPVYWHSFLLYALVGSLAVGAGYLLRRTETSWLVKALGPTATWFLGWWLLIRRFTRLRVRNRKRL